jgi:hypothetical protein
MNAEFEILSTPSANTFTIDVSELIHQTLQIQLQQQVLFKSMLEQTLQPEEQVGVLEVGIY